MAVETNDRVKFELDGTLYEFPDVLDLDIDEWIVMYEYAGLVLEDFAPHAPALAAASVEVANLAVKAGKLPEGAPEREKVMAELDAARENLARVRENLTDEEAAAESDRVHKLRHPGFLKAMAHIAYQRANPRKTKAAIKDLIGSVKVLPMYESMVGEEAEADDPPTPANGQQQSSERTRDASLARLSPPSPLNSETPEDLPAPIGTTG